MYLSTTQYLPTYIPHCHPLFGPSTCNRFTTVAAHLYTPKCSSSLVSGLPPRRPRLSSPLRCGPQLRVREVIAWVLRLCSQNLPHCGSSCDPFLVNHSSPMDSQDRHLLSQTAVSRERSDLYLGNLLQPSSSARQLVAMAAMRQRDRCADAQVLVSCSFLVFQSEMLLLSSEIPRFRPSDI